MFDGSGRKKSISQLFKEEKFMIYFLYGYLSLSLKYIGFGILKTIWMYFRILNLVFFFLIYLSQNSIFDPIEINLN